MSLLRQIKKWEKTCTKENYIRTRNRLKQKLCLKYLKKNFVHLKNYTINTTWYELLTNEQRKILWSYLSYFQKETILQAARNSTDLPSLELIQKEWKSFSKEIQDKLHQYVGPITIQDQIESKTW